MRRAAAFSNGKVQYSVIIVGLTTTGASVAYMFFLLISGLTNEHL